MSRTVVRVSAFLVTFSLALAAMRAYSDDPPKKPADDDPFSEGADAAPAMPAKPVAPQAKAQLAMKPSPDGRDDPFDPESETVAPAKPVAPSAKASPVKPARPAKPASQPQKSKPAVKLHGGEKAILKALKQKTALEFGETPLKDIIDSIKKANHIPIILDAGGLKDAGVEPDTPVTIDVSGISLQSALEILLDDLQLKWAIHHDVLMITSPAKAESDEFMETKVYDVTDVVIPVPDTSGLGNPLSTPSATGLQPRDTTSAWAQGNLGLKAMGQPQTSDFSNASTDFTPLMDLIQNTVLTKSWVENGGAGTISDMPPGCLVITQTREVHQQIERLLADLRDSRRRAPAFTVELHWLWLDAAHRDELLAARANNKAPRSQRINLQRLRQIASEVPSFHANVECVNGARTVIASGDRRSMIVSAIPVIGSGVGYSPIISVPNIGITAEVRPTATASGKAVLLFARTMITRRTHPRKPAIVGSAWPAENESHVEPATANTTPPAAPTVHVEKTDSGSGSCPIDLPVMPTQEFGTTLRMPLGKPVVVGSITFAPDGDAGVGAATKDAVEVYLIATTSLVKKAKKKP